MSGTDHFVFRLKQGQDLKKSIHKFVDQQQFAAGWNCTCIGSLTNYSIRFANQKITTMGGGHFEISATQALFPQMAATCTLALLITAGKSLRASSFAYGNLP